MARRKDDPGSPPGAALTILVVRSGGFAGISQQWRVEAHDDQEQWLELVRACPWGAVRRDTESRDRFVWRIEAHLRLPLSLTFDHRSVTGGEAARFMAALLADLERET